MQVLLAKLQENDITLESIPKTSISLSGTSSGVSDSGFADSIGVNSCKQHGKAKNKKFSSLFCQVIEDCSGKTVPTSFHYKCST